MINFNKTPKDCHLLETTTTYSSFLLGSSYSWIKKHHLIHNSFITANNSKPRWIETSRDKCIAKGIMSAHWTLHSLHFITLWWHRPRKEMFSKNKYVVEENKLWKMFPCFKSLNWDKTHRHCSTNPWTPACKFADQIFWGLQAGVSHLIQQAFS